MPVNGFAATSVAAGILFTWSGIRGWNATATLGEIIAGKRPSGTEQYMLTAPGSGGGSVTGSAVSDDAMQYKGHAYIFGGSPGRQGKNPWDCSSFVNWVVGHDLHHAIPGSPGGYDGSSHGPTTLLWGAWPGLRKISRAQVQAGDIIVWTGHMGIAISNTQMISAEDPADGTKVGNIDGGGNGPLMKYGRLV